MERIRSRFSLIILATGVISLFTYCTKHDEVLNLASPSTTNTTTGTVLTSIKGSATVFGTGQGVWDGSLEAAWNNAPKLTMTATVPTPGNNIFTGFNGNVTNVTMRSMYDASNIYFLVEWDADQNNCASSPWYFNPTTHLWAQEAGAPVLNADGTSFRPPFIQDEFVMAFDINNSTPEFVSQSCYGACHINSSYGGPAIQGGAMWTNGPSEALDCWRARTIQVLNENQANDCSITWNSGILNKQSVPADAQLKPTDGGLSNKQSMVITGKKTKVNVPLYVYPTGTYTIYPTMTKGPFGAMYLSDTGNKAIKVIAVDSNGVLTLANHTTIDPGTTANGTNYQQVGGGDGKYCIPGSITAPYSGSRGDVTANMFYTGTGWKLLFKRALNTGDAVADVDFSSLKDQLFGIGVMFNGADNEHAITNGLTLTFQK